MFQKFERQGRLLSSFIKRIWPVLLVVLFHEMRFLNWGMAIAASKTRIVLEDLNAERIPIS
ncbi:MAG: hypothetical protein CMJ20_12820 [Phycisphaeraceae bacterium]|nr:hypothetical protein [Phycisphaeraceae bacterium]